MEWIISISSGVTALATIVIAIYAWKSHSLASTLNERDDEFREQVSDLYKAIVISSMVANPGAGMADTMTGRIKLFREHYDGTTKIFKK